jgi:predicted glycosyltransferase
MNILIDINHPAHIHYFRNVARELTLKGHKVIWTIKDSELIKNLLDSYGYTYTILPKKQDGLLLKGLKQIEYNYKLFKICRREKIEIAIGTSVSIAQVSLFSGFKSLIFDDDDDAVQPLVTKFVHPFADCLLSPESLINKRKRKDTVFYPGYHELAYLHPKRFVPNSHVLNELNLTEKDTFFIFRFNAFKAHHDIGVAGLKLEQKLKLIENLKPYGKIFITTERNIEPELKEYQLTVSPEKIHSLMYYATLFLGDSQTMTSEAAVLGVPSLRCNSLAGEIAYLEEEENRYGLTYAFKPQNFSVMEAKLKELLTYNDIKSEWKKRQQKMLEDKIDVTSFWVWFIEKYPASKKEVKNTPDFWAKFK